MLCRSSPTYTRSASSPGDQLENRVLQRVRVLELVDEQVADARLHRRARLGIADEQVARPQLEVGEVERGRRQLACAVDAVEALDESDDLGMQDTRDLAARSELEQRELHLVPRERAGRVLQLVGGEIDEILGRRTGQERHEALGALAVLAGIARGVVRDRQVGLLGERARGSLQILHPRAEGDRGRDRRRAAGRAGAARASAAARPRTPQADRASHRRRSPPPPRASARAPRRG